MRGRTRGRPLDPSRDTVPEHVPEYVPPSVPECVPTSRYDSRTVTHQVLSLKYRPQRFDQLKGQGHVTRILQNALATDRVGHAYLLVGPRGVGKTTTARIFARALNCAAHRGPAGSESDASTAATPEAGAPEAFEPCGTCPSCVDIAAGADLDVVEMDAASNNAVDDVRALREQVGYATVRSRYRIWIVDEVHMLSLPAFNAFLKTLEEPPAQVKFIFCTTEEHKLPDTFRSRCQRIELRPIEDAVITERLNDLAVREQVTLGEGLAQAIAHGALGGLRDAESQLEQLIAAVGSGMTLSLADLESLSGRASGELLTCLMEAVDRGEPGGALDAVDACLGAGAKPGVLLDQWLDGLRDQMLAGARRASTNGDPAAGGAGYAKPARAIDILLAKRMHLRAGAAGDLVLQVAAVELARLPDARDLDALIVALRDAGRGAGQAAGQTVPGGAADESAPPGPPPRGPERGAPAPARSAPVRTPSSEPRGPDPVSAGEPVSSPDSASSSDSASSPDSISTPDAASALRAPRRRGAPVDAPLLVEYWDELVRRAAARIPAIADALAQGSVQAVRGGALQVALPDGAAEARGTLMRRDVQLAFGQVVREVLGSYLRLEVVEAPVGAHSGGPAGADIRIHPSIHRVTEATGGRLLNVERDSTSGAVSATPEARGPAAAETPT